MWTIECIIRLIIDILILSYPQDDLFFKFGYHCIYLSSGVTFRRNIDLTMVSLIYSAKAISFTCLIFLAKFGPTFEKHRSNYGIIHIFCKSYIIHLYTQFIGINIIY